MLCVLIGRSPHIAIYRNVIPRRVTVGVTTS
jgi:hypothetical protein